MDGPVRMEGPQYTFSKDLSRIEHNKQSVLNHQKSTVLDFIRILEKIDIY